VIPGHVKQVRGGRRLVDKHKDEVIERNAVSSSRCQQYGSRRSARRANAAGGKSLSHRAHHTRDPGL